ncbi:MAG TPA: FHA domain-containing protein [Polyangiaceae bacterium]
MDSHPPTSSSPRPPRNAATCNPSQLEAWAKLRREAPSFDEVCARVVSEGDASGHRLHWTSASSSGSCDLPASRDAYLVVGRHSSCNVVLGADPCVALRHVIVRSSVLDDGCPVVSVLDLRTRDGFQINDGTVQRSIVATGPLAFRIGAYVLVALPGGVPPEAAFQPPACERAEAHPYRVASQRLGGQPPQSRRVVSRITLMPGAEALSVRPASALLREDARHELSLDARGRRASIVLSGADLDRGVIVGRDPRCVDAGLRAILDGGISRMHLLLRRDARGGIVAFDLASTQGTWGEGRRVRSVHLADAGTTLSMGMVNPVRLQWRRL